MSNFSSKEISIFISVPLLAIVVFQPLIKNTGSERELRRINYLDDKKINDINKKEREINYLHSKEKDKEAIKLSKEVYKIKLSIARMYEDFLKKHPDNKKALNFLGLVYYDNLHNPEMAEKCWKKALKIDPKFSPALNNLATYYSHFGKHIKGIELLREAIKSNPDIPIYHFNLFNSYIIFRYEVQKKYKWSLQEVFHNAVKEAEKARELDSKNFRYTYELAEIYYLAPYFKVKPKWEKVLSIWESCLPLARTPAEKANLYLHIGRVNAYLDRKKEAQEAFIKSNEILPSLTARHLLRKLKKDGNNKGNKTR